MDINDEAGKQKEYKKTREWLAKEKKGKLAVYLWPSLFRLEMCVQRDSALLRLVQSGPHTMRISQHSKPEKSQKSLVERELIKSRV